MSEKKKSLGTPKVALPKATEFNQIVTLDLKFFKNQKNPVLWMIDAFSKLCVGTVVKDKEMETILKAIDSKWCLTWGFPQSHFWSDNGKEFLNKNLRKYSEKMGIKIEFGPQKYISMN